VQDPWWAQSFTPPICRCAFVGRPREAWASHLPSCTNCVAAIQLNHLQVSSLDAVKT